MPEQDAEYVPCQLGHARKAMECPACSDSTDVAWWKWYRGRTSSTEVRARVTAWLAAQNGPGAPDA